MRKLIGVALLLFDDLALHPLDMLEIAGFYGLCVERHHRKSMVLASAATQGNGWLRWLIHSSPSPLSTD
jgi:hypothetical protein